MMTSVPAQLTSSATRAAACFPAALLARQLAAAGLGVQYTPQPHQCRLTILGAPTSRSCLTLEDGGQARWYYEPAAGPLTNPATLTAIIAYLLGAPGRPGPPGALPRPAAQGSGGPVPAEPGAVGCPAGQ